MGSPAFEEYMARIRAIKQKLGGNPFARAREDDLGPDKRRLINELFSIRRQLEGLLESLPPEQDSETPEAG